ncbi:hypothetical protein PMG11_04758 [Penicillium brasilianum]|uniref:Uncharacterized protein n=1 Tax=Penicillium brasilianum TaxID=104259 RepID=A0A0F7VDL9_PENBI|nr:hypothetical protein PMG11_04758 [Penicillium brasilianum]
MSTDPALSQAQPCDPSQPPSDENSFRFTPIKALRAIPRLWERKPATPFKAGLKRKLWKRFQSSFSNMQTLESSTALDHDALQTAINTSKDSAYVRGVKRLCVGPGESAEIANVEVPQPGRPFLETKWESEMSRKRRKLPDAPFDVYDESLNATSDRTTSRRSDGHYDLDADGDLAMGTASPILFKSLRTPPKTAIFQDNMPTKDSNLTTSDTKSVEQIESGSSDQEQGAVSGSVVQRGNGDVTATPTKLVRSLTQAQEGTLVRSALRSSLDGDDAMVLSDFLSKAMAKRAVKAAQVSSQESDSADKSSSPETSPDSECATPPSRRALGDRDANSPSPVKAQIAPSKGKFIPGDETREDVVIKETQDEEVTAPASPACRRSTRVKAPPANAPPVRSTISLRRAKGNEFIFMQRTDSQELALATRRNTRNNRGNSMMPKYVLQAMAQEDSSATDSDIQSQPRADHKNLGSRKVTSKSRKTVTWNEARMAEYEGDTPTPASSDAGADTDAGATLERDESRKHDVDGGSSRARSGARRSEKNASSSSRSSRKQLSQKAELESGPTVPASTAEPVSTTSKPRRVRRLGDSVMASGTPVKTGTGRISKTTTLSASDGAPATATTGPSTPTKPRRKLVPKSPSSSLLSVPASKASSSNGGEQHFVSGIPTRSTTSSEGVKRKSMAEANAGCTPMPRRVRARS